MIVKSEKVGSSHDKSAVLPAVGWVIPATSHFLDVVSYLAQLASVVPTLDNTAVILFPVPMAVVSTVTSVVFPELY